MRRYHHRITAIIVLTTLVFALTGCSGTNGSEAPTPTFTTTDGNPPPPGMEPAAGDEGLSPSEMDERDPNATSTPAPTVTEEPPSYDPDKLDAMYMGDITIPDGTVIQPGASFVKTWILKNTGSIDWPEGTRLYFVRGDGMLGPDSVAVPSAVVGDSEEATVDLVGPDASGSYRGYWQLRAPDGTYFGPQIYVDIVVP